MTMIYMTDEIKKRFLVPFRELFALDLEFPYNKDDAKASRISISAKYPDAKNEGKFPAVVVGVSNYNVSNITLASNFHEETGVRSDGTLTGRKFANKVNFVVSIESYSTLKAEAEKLSDKFFNILHTHFSSEFRSILGIDCRTISVGEAQATKTYPQYNWVSSVVVQGDLTLTSVLYYPAEYENVLNNVGMLVSLDLKD